MVKRRARRDFTFVPDSVPRPGNRRRVCALVPGGAGPRRTLHSAPWNQKFPVPGI